MSKINGTNGTFSPHLTLPLAQQNVPRLTIHDEAHFEEWAGNAPPLSADDAVKLHIWPKKGVRVHLGGSQKSNVSRKDVIIFRSAD